MKKYIAILLCLLMALPLCAACQNVVMEKATMPSSEIHEISPFIRRAYFAYRYPREDFEKLRTRIQEALERCADEHGIALEELPTAREYVILYLTYGFGYFSYELPTGVFTADYVFNDQENIQGSCPISIKLSCGYHGAFGMYEEAVRYIYLGDDMKCIVFPDESSETGKGTKFLCRPVVMPDGLEMVQAGDVQHSIESGVRLIEELSGLYDDNPHLKGICLYAFPKRLKYITSPSYYPEFVTAYLDGTPGEYPYTLNLVDAEGNTYGFEFERMHEIVYFNSELVYFHFNPV